MKFAAIIEYGEDKESIEAFGPAHRTYLRGLLASGRLVAAGPFADDAGALWVYEAETREAAEALLRDDPYTAAGVFATWRIRPMAYWSAKAHKGT